MGLFSLYSMCLSVCVLVRVWHTKEELFVKGNLRINLHQINTGAQWMDMDVLCQLSEYVS